MPSASSRWRATWRCSPRPASRPRATSSGGSRPMSSSGESSPSISSAVARPCAAPSSAGPRSSASRHRGVATSRASLARAGPFSSTNDPAVPPGMARGCRARRSQAHDLGRARSTRGCGHGRRAIRERAVSLEALVGRRLMFGLPGPDLTDDDVHLFRETQAAGIMLYRRNFETPDRLARLLTGLEEAIGRQLLVATDHEGGRIIMLGRAVTIFPDNLAAGTAGEVTFVHRQGLFEGRELRRLGVDVNFSPVLDVLTERYSPNIGIRSYGKDPALVARYGAARIRGLQSAGVSACAKHFPGKGHAPLDAHLGLPVIDSDWAEMHAGHLPPFLAAMDAGVDCIMTSHPLY